MYLHLLSEKDLRIRIRQGWAEVFLRNSPDTILGMRYVESQEDIEHFDEALDKITEVIGPLMPADLVEERFLSIFDGIAYLSGGTSCCNCPRCSSELTKEKVPLIESLGQGYFYCPFCSVKVKVEVWDCLPEKKSRQK